MSASASRFRIGSALRKTLSGGPISKAAISFSSQALRRRAAVEVLDSSIGQSLTAYVKVLYLAMVFEWDETKSIINAKARGLPFEIAMALFDGPTLESLDRRRDYGEPRVKAIGRVIGQILVCVYTDREAVRRIISLRAANRRERDAYRAAYKG
jgi:uncharacterized protein